jgi:hypothetical protein
VNEDLAATYRRMESNRGDLLAAIQGLTVEDMARDRPGSWSAGRVLQHVIDSEVAYVKLLAHLRGKQAPELSAEAPHDGADAVSQLQRTRAALVEMTDGVDDETLYRLTALGANDYSVLSVLENDADHDHEHLLQIERLVNQGWPSLYSRQCRNVPVILQDYNSLYGWYRPSYGCGDSRSAARRSAEADQNLQPLCGQRTDDVRHRAVHG